MAKIGHYYISSERSEVRVFAPERGSVALVLPASLPGAPDDRTLPMERDALGYWRVELERLAVGSRYWIEIDGRRYPDIASRCQPDGVHGASMVVEPVGATRAGWRGVEMEDAVIYELHLGTFTPEGTLAAAAERLAYLADLGINVVELLPIAAFPGHRNWGYDGTYPFALQVDYGSLADLTRFIERAHALGMAVVLDVVYNHFGPEGNYTAAYAPYTCDAATPWGAAINFDGPYNYGVREFFLENARWWLQDIGFDGFRMDAVSAIFDTMPVHILRAFTDLARTIGAAENRHVLMIAEHLRNDRRVTSQCGFHFDAQWNDDVHDSIFAWLTGETARHLQNFGSFADVVKALDHGFVLDGSRFDHYRRFMTGTDGRATSGAEHIVYVQNHDQVGNRPHGDRMIASHGKAKALLALTAVMATAFVPMLFMGDEFGATSPFLFFEDFGDPQIVVNVRAGRKREFELVDGVVEMADPHLPATFEASRLQWSALDEPESQSVLAYTRQLIAMKRSGELGPRDRAALRVSGDVDTRVVRIETPETVTLLNFSAVPRRIPLPPSGWQLALSSLPVLEAGRADIELAPFAALLYRQGPTDRVTDDRQARALP